MDIQKPNSQWAKSTEGRLELFFDDYLIRCPITKVRVSAQKLLESLFRKGNAQQKSRIIQAIQKRCDQLICMGRASENFLGLVKRIFMSVTDYQEQKKRIINKVFSKLQVVHNNMVNNNSYEFYSFASNLVDFGNQQFKPYLLEANGCLNCFGIQETKSEIFKPQKNIKIVKAFTNKLEFVFKRIYQVKDLVINFKPAVRTKSITAFYIDEKKQMKKIGKFKIKQQIPVPLCKTQGFYFQFQLPNQNNTNHNFKKRAVQCIFCQSADQMNFVCATCVKKLDMVDITGSLRVVGADEQLISNELCADYEKIKDNISSIRKLHQKIEKKQKISLNFKLDEMMEIYQRIINNIGLLHNNHVSVFKPNENQNCFSCNYYQTLSIINFLKEIIKSSEQFPILKEEIENEKSILKDCLSKNKMQSLKTNLLETLAVFIVNSEETDFRKQFNENNNYLADLIAKVIVAIKEKKTQEDNLKLNQIISILKQKWTLFTSEQKIRIFVCLVLEWDFLSLVLDGTFNQLTQMKRLSQEIFQQLSGFIDFSLQEVFNYPLTPYLKAFLRIIPFDILPVASLDIRDCQFLQYVDNKIPQIQKRQIQQSIICCPNPMIRLDMFASLPILVPQLPVKESMKVMNSLFPFRNVWNLNIMKACQKFSEKLSQLPPEQQISTCLYGYLKSSQPLYINKIYKLLVPQRLQFIIRLEAPHSEIEMNGVQHPYIPIRDVKSSQLQGDTIGSLHSWIYNQLGKINQQMPLDIIVQKNIIDNMDLPIEIVFNHIAENKSKRKIGDQQYDYFKVIYRVQGILGEPKQRSIGGLRDNKLETCIGYSSLFLNRMSDEFKDKIGLDVLIEILESIRPGPESQDKKVLLFEILSTLSMNEAICKKIVQGQYGDSIINATVRLMSFQNEKDAKITNFLLELSSKVIDEANKQMINLRKGSAGEYRKMSGMDIQTSNAQSENKVTFVLSKITQCQSTFEKTGNTLYRDISKKLIKLLPFCSKDEYQASKIIFNFFDFSNWASKSSSKMQRILIFMDSLSESYLTFKSIVQESGITKDIIKIITNAIRKENSKEIDEKKLSVNRSLTESGLALLYSLVQGDEKLQSQLFETQFFHNIVKISEILPQKSQSIGAGRIPENCFKIIKYFKEGKIVYSKISEFLDQKKKLQKKMNQPKKMSKMQQMKNKQKAILSKRMQDQDQEQKDPITCSSCHEGYLKKKQILGLYIYQVKTEIPIQANWWKQTRKVVSYSSSTYFTTIHFECHLSAMQSDQKMMRSQWDGALIRNMDVLCNSWIPFKGPKSTFDQITRGQRKYFQKNKTGNYWNALNDLTTLIDKLSMEFDFATESKGSTSSHNFRYVPILLSFTCHLIDKSGGCAVVQEGIKFLLENPPKSLNMVNLLIGYSLIIHNYQTFVGLKPKLLNFITSLKSEGNTPEKTFSEIKTSLLYLKIVQQIYEIIHKNIPKNENQNSSKFYKEVDFYICFNLYEVIQQFESLNERFKTKYTKFTRIEDFEF